jgi:hypothetical protein
VITRDKAREERRKAREERRKQRYFQRPSILYKLD